MKKRRPIDVDTYYHLYVERYLPKGGGGKTDLEVLVRPRDIEPARARNNSDSRYCAMMSRDPPTSVESRLSSPKSLKRFHSMSEPRYGLCAYVHWREPDLTGALELF
jgi:hypothetical protein